MSAAESSALPQLAYVREGSARPPDNVRLYRYTERFQGWLVDCGWEFVGELPESAERLAPSLAEMQETIDILSDPDTMAAIREGQQGDEATGVDLRSLAGSLDVARIEWALFGTTEGDLLDDDAEVPVGELRRLLRNLLDPPQ